MTWKGASLLFQRITWKVSTYRWIICRVSWLTAPAEEKGPVEFMLQSCINFESAVPEVLATPAFQL